MTFKQLSIWWVDLEPTRGAESQKKRPCVVLQSSMLNLKTQTVVVAPILPNHKPWPFAVNLLPNKENGLDKDRHVNLKQLRVVDISRIQNQSGTLEMKYLPEIQEAIELVFGMGKWMGMQ